jgi:hypothetical protein
VIPEPVRYSDTVLKAVCVLFVISVSVILDVTVAFEVLKLEIMSDVVENAVEVTPSIVFVVLVVPVSN